jgi:hypothetical protein
MLVVDLGSGAFPNARADVLCDRDLIDNRHRAGLRVVVDRPLVRGDAAALPFREGAIDFIIASHIAEHVADPDAFCRELSRAACAGYVETPSPLADVLLHEDYHIWRVSGRGGVLTFRAKQPPGPVAVRLTRPFYKLFNAAQPMCSQPTYRLPSGNLGRACAMAIKVFTAGLNRLGVMHTRVLFSPARPLKWRVVGVPCEVSRGD